MMGIWFVSSALGLIVAGILAGEFRADSIDTMPALYLQIVLTTAGSGLLLAVFARPDSSIDRRRTLEYRLITRRMNHACFPGCRL